MMARLAARYPGYGWEHNQGYATLEHRRAIRRLGLTPFHRRSFLALQRTLAGDQVSLDLFGDEPDHGLLDGLSDGGPEGLEGLESADMLDLADAADRADVAEAAGLAGVVTR